MLKEDVEIKDYTLRKFLGRGGFGEVWLAEKKIEIADKKVSFALKFISGDNQNVSDFSSVRREINTWIEASGNNNVVSVLDGFIYENYFVIVSEYADGGSLRHWLRANDGKSPNLDKTVEIMGGILDGLSHLHAQKIVHRDLKPENILLKGEMPCIADFGVSKMIETVSLSSSQLGTNSAGSPLYMSPESFERIKPAPQIDVWSAGVILFEMLSGKTPYSGDTIPALIFEIVTKEPRQLPAGIPSEIQKVVKKSLAKNVIERFQTAKEMKDALMKALYLQDYVLTVSDEELQKSKPSGDILLQEKTLSEVKTLQQGFTESGSKKFFSWTYATKYAAAGLVLMLGAVGLASFVLIGNRVDNFQQRPTMSNQSMDVVPTPTVASTPNATLNSNAAVATPKTENVNTAKPKESKTPQPAETSKEKPLDTKTETVLKVTPTPKKVVIFPAKPRPPANTDKKPTLDDLLKKNQSPSK